MFFVYTFLLGEPAENAIFSCSLQLYHIPDKKKSVNEIATDLI